MEDVKFSREHYVDLIETGKKLSKWNLPVGKDFKTYAAKTGKGESMLIKKERVYNLAHEMAADSLGADPAYFAEEGKVEVIKQLEYISELAKELIKEINGKEDK